MVLIFLCVLLMLNFAPTLGILVSTTVKSPAIVYLPSLPPKIGKPDDFLNHFNKNREVSKNHEFFHQNLPSNHKYDVTGSINLKKNTTTNSLRTGKRIDEGTSSPRFYYIARVPNSSKNSSVSGKANRRKEIGFYDPVRTVKPIYEPKVEDFEGHGGNRWEGATFLDPPYEKPPGSETTGGNLQPWNANGGEGDPELPKGYNFEEYESPGKAEELRRTIEKLNSLIYGGDDNNNNHYNTPLHLPPNPIVSLILSHYGRYLPGSRNSRRYSYMAVNNIHNYQPFGRYKQEKNEEPVEVLR